MDRFTTFSKHNVFIIDAQDKIQIVHTKSIGHLVPVSDHVYYITNKAYDDDHVLTLPKSLCRYLILNVSSSIPSYSHIELVKN